jgi:hypothetical protein
MTPDELQPKPTIARRKMLKRIGTGAAIAWTAPVLTSVQAPALAAYPFCGGNDCVGCVAAPCQIATPCGGRKDCNCWKLSPDNGGGCKCLFFVDCAQFADCSQHGQRDCDVQAPGMCCVDTCCGLQCAPPCGFNLPTR